MKKKFSLMWRVAIALVLVLSFSLVAAVPVAADVGPATVTPDPANMDNAAEYTIEFTTNEDLAITADDDIRIRFPEDTTVPGGYTNNSISINGTDVDTGVGDVDVTIDVPTRQFIIDVPEDIPHGTVTVVFKLAADIVNPSTKGWYTLEVSTSREVTWVVSDEYEITGPVGPVDLYLKYQCPFELCCGAISYEYQDSYETIQAALDVADELFWFEGFWTEEWYLFTECPPEGGYIGALIEVHPGTYAPIVIDTPGVEVRSTEGRAVTFIDGTIEPESCVDGWGAAVCITAGGCTFDGFTVKNAGVGVDADGDWPDEDLDLNADIRGILVMMDSDKNDVPIFGVFNSTVLPIADPMYYGAEMARVNILNNEVYNSTASGIVAIDACVLVSGNDVHDNEFDGFYGEGLYNGVQIVDPTAFTPNPGQPYACTEINENEFTDNGEGRNELDAAYGYDYWMTDNGIQITTAYYDGEWLVEGGYEAATLYIVGNDISGNSNAGIYLGLPWCNDGPPDIWDAVVIKFNQIEDNDVFGISCHRDYPIWTVCIYNDIEGNGVWGIKNWAPLEYLELYPDSEPQDYHWLVATHNYWDDLSGPSLGPAPVAHELSQQSDALGAGDAVSHYVEYRWWLTSSFKIVQTGLIRHYGSDLSGPHFTIPKRPIVLLKQGWNTMSTPVALDERADQLSEILALGGWMQQLEIAFTYDPVNGWRNIEEGVYDPPLMPLEAMLVKMAGPETYVDLQDEPYADRLPILLRTTNWLPARDLEPGWNLVGPNIGFWSQDGGPPAWVRPVDEVLSSIAGSWGVAISPDMPGQRVAWVTTSSSPSGMMHVGDGYWVFITKSTTLAGFRMAPWYLQDWEMDILNCELPPWWPNNK